LAVELFGRGETLVPLLDRHLSFAVFLSPVLRGLASPSGGSTVPPQPVVQCALDVRRCVPLKGSWEHTPEALAQLWEFLYVQRKFPVCPRE
jgi:hypothetical protein